MSQNDLINLFVKYGIIPPGEQESAIALYDEELEIEINALELLSAYASERSIWFGLGDCVDENVIADFMQNFETIIEIANGRVQLQKISVSPEIGTEIGHGNINISFTWNNKDYHLSFTKFEPDDFINGFANWVHEALNGDFLFINDDHPFGYHIPKELVNELKAIGL